MEISQKVKIDSFELNHFGTGGCFGEYKFRGEKLFDLWKCYDYRVFDLFRIYGKILQVR